MKLSLHSVPSVESIDPVTLDLDGREMTFACPKLALWRESEVAISIIDGTDASEAHPEDVRDAYKALRAFMAAAMGGERAYARFARRYDEHQLLIVFNTLRIAWKDDVTELGLKAAELAKAAARDGA